MQSPKITKLYNAAGAAFEGAAASNADLTTEVVDSLGYSVLWWEIRLAGTTSPVFSIKYRGGLYAGAQGTDSTLLATQTLAAGDTSVETDVTLHADGYVSVAGSAGDKLITICIENPPKLSALFLDNGGGGSASLDKITVRHWLTGKKT